MDVYMWKQEAVSVYSSQLLQVWSAICSEFLLNFPGVGLTQFILFLSGICHMGNTC